ncbi:MAG: DUF3418 domain-containing protein [Gammaproteobacteria bacterium]
MKPVRVALIKAFPALVDEGEGVRLQLFDTACAARQSMQKGLLRLFILALPQQVHSRNSISCQKSGVALCTVW